MKLIDKDAVVTEIDRIQNTTMDKNQNFISSYDEGKFDALTLLENYINTLEVKDPYEQCVQYPSIKDGIEAHASIYSFNIESQLFPQLTKEQQALWRKEIEQACISGGDAGVTLARDQRYKENFEMKEVNLVEELDYDDYITFFKEHPDYNDGSWGFEETWTFAQYCYTLGLKAQKGE